MNVLYLLLFSSELDRIHYMFLSHMCLYIQRHSDSRNVLTKHGPLCDNANPLCI